MNLVSMSDEELQALHTELTKKRSQMFREGIAKEHIMENQRQCDEIHQELKKRGVIK